MFSQLPPPYRNAVRGLWPLLMALVCLFLAFTAGRGYERQRICDINKLSPEGCRLIMQTLYEPVKVKPSINEDNL